MDGSRPHVLVVDDMADAADTLALILDLSGYDAQALYCGPSALAAVRNRRPAAVILDIGMSPMNGFVFTSQFRELPGCERTAVVVVSGHTSAAYQERGRELGINHYLFKPADPSELLALLERLTSTQSQANQRRPRDFCHAESGTAERIRMGVSGGHTSSTPAHGTPYQVAQEIDACCACP